MANTTMLHVRVDADLKARATEVLDKLGLNVSDAVRLLLNRVAEEKRLPLDLDRPPFTFPPSPLSPDEMRQIQSESMADFLERLRRTIGDTDIDLEAVIQEHRQPHRGVDL